MKLHQGQKKPVDSVYVAGLEKSVEDMSKKIRRYEDLLLSIKLSGLTAKNLEDLEDLNLYSKK